MASNPYDPTQSAFHTASVGYASNGGVNRYLFEAESTTGFSAWKLADETILISNALQVSLPASPAISFWSCASYTDSTPDGDIILFDGHSNLLTRLDVNALTRLKYLDCCYNQLASLNVAGLMDLEVLDADHNQLTALEVRGLRTLRILNCASNRLKELDVSGLTGLQILDCSDNQLMEIKFHGCTNLQDFRSAGNPAGGSKTRL